MIYTRRNAQTARAVRSEIAMISENVKKTLAEIAGGNPFGEKITLVAATKTRTPEEINEAIVAGITDIGENKVQEFTEKFDAVHGANRHFIGHLQTNKVKYLIGKTFLIHSLDRFELADELQKRAQKAGWTADCLIEVNIGSELSKSGFSLEDAPAAYERLKSYQNIRIKGLMAMLPLSDDRAMLAALCKKMRALYDALRAEDGNIEHLSMGMSGDWRLCAENGSNMIRLGTSLFGPRNYPAPAANVQG